MAKYRFKEMAQSESSGFAKSIDFVDTTKAIAWSPAYTNAGTIFRFLPTYSDEGEISPCRYSYESHDYGDWIRAYPAIRRIGEPDKDPVSFFLGDVSDPGFDEKMTPVWVLYNAVTNAVNSGNEGQGWAAMLKGSRGKAAVLPKPGRVYVAPALVVRHADKQPYVPYYGLQDNSKPIIATLSASAGSALRTVLDEMNPNEAADSPYLFDDIINLSSGKYVALYPKKMGPPMDVQYNIPAEYKNNLLLDARSATYDGYGCAVMDSYNAASPVLDQYPGIVNKLTNFERVLYFPSIEEQARLVATRIRSDVIMYAWRDFPEWIPADVRNRAVNAHSVALPVNPVAQPQSMIMPPMAPPAAPTPYPMPPAPPAPVQRCATPPEPPQQQHAMAWATQNNPLSEIPAEHQPKNVLPQPPKPAPVRPPQPVQPPTETVDPILQNYFDDKAAEEYPDFDEESPF